MAIVVASSPGPSPGGGAWGRGYHCWYMLRPRLQVSRIRCTVQVSDSTWCPKSEIYCLFANRAPYRDEIYFSTPEYMQGQYSEGWVKIVKLSSTASPRRSLPNPLSLDPACIRVWKSDGGVIEGFQKNSHKR